LQSALPKAKLLAAWNGGCDRRVYGLNAAGVIDPGTVHDVVDRTSYEITGVGFQQIQRSDLQVEPTIVCVGRNDDRHPIVEFGNDSLCGASDQRACLDTTATWLPVPA
jgi:hypothetical protein